MRTADTAGIRSLGRTTLPVHPTWLVGYPRSPDGDSPSVRGAGGASEGARTTRLSDTYSRVVSTGPSTRAILRTTPAPS